MTLSIEEVEERLKKVLLERTGHLKAEEIHSGVALVGKGLALDSVALLEFIVGLEEEFDLILDDSALTVEHFEALGTLARYVRAQLQELRAS